MTEKVDIFISGAGISGLIAAAAFGRAGFSVVVADPMPPVPASDADGSDLRATAYLRPGRDLIEDAGLWDVLSDHATSLDILRVIDTTGWPPKERCVRDFRADDLGNGPFGWNLPNWLTRKVLSNLLAKTPGVDLRLGVGFASTLSRETEALVRLTDGSNLRAALVIGADGRTSPVRESAGIGARVTRYGQKALALSVTHPKPHENVSTEIYNSGGAFTLVPGQPHGGQHSSSVVWMNDGSRAAALMAMDDTALNTEMTRRSCGVLGDLTLASPRQVWPIVTQVAERLTAGRVALVAEAAHVLPPIGAQGLNTSLRDVAALLDIAKRAPGDLGSAAMLRSYEQARLRDVHLRATAIDLFNRVCKSDSAAVQKLRLVGLTAVHDIAPVRRAVMRAGLGAQTT
ncbi:MAG: FAD-dependent monooxygenase [Pseudomonadota bacterium]